MANVDSELLLYTMGALVIKSRRCLVTAPYQQQIAKLYVMYKKLKEFEKSKKKIWVREIFTAEQRFLQGSSHNLIEEMRHKDKKKFFNYLRMLPETFDVLLTTIEPHIRKQNLVREPIEPKIRLELTLRYLASGDSMTSLSYNFRVGKQTVSTIISETCEALWLCLKDQVFITPTLENWKQISNEFNEKWNFKNCIGAIDGKHVNIQALPKSGSRYYNYKGAHSVNLLAISDASYKFIMVDIGAPGKSSDSGVFRQSEMGKGFERNAFNVPMPSEDGLPYVLVGDEAFPLTNYLMRPYPRRDQLDLQRKVFNYRLSRARRIDENAFGLLVTKWQIFRKPILASECTVRKIIQACVCLHNFLLMQSSENEMFNNHEGMNELIPTTDGLRDMARAGTNTYARNVANSRELFTNYFCGPGAVQWQWEKAMNNDLKK